jgi:hypothetical protein
MGYQIMLLHYGEFNLKLMLEASETKWPYNPAYNTCNLMHLKVMNGNDLLHLSGMLDFNQTVTLGKCDLNFL